MPKSFTQKLFNQSMRRATRLTGMGAWMDATRLIQKTLAGSAQAHRREDRQPQYAANDPKVIDIEAREVSRNEVQPNAAPARPHDHPASQPVQQPHRHEPDTASFSSATLRFDKHDYPYRLFIPPRPAAGSSAGLMPLVVLLHGCKQDALDFSNGTAMNVLASEHGCMVLYPEQIASANAAMCWNWFEPGHQKPDRGEPGMIAALVRKVIAQHGADPERVYIAGLSAGGAMAAVVAGLYPQLFAALGVHSGLAAGAAQDLMSAFKAMRSGAKGKTRAAHKSADKSALPTIVFHGTADKTVHPDNGDFIADAALAALKDSGLALHKSSPTAPGGSAHAERVVYSNAEGKPYVEHWSVSGGQHAWSGGDAAGSYTDPEGPSASRAMLTFFLQHCRGQKQARPGQ